MYQPYRLPGQQYDEESGLYYNRHRYYDPLQGRYISNRLI
ncbi:RHS repeat-associated core domain-containing protein [Escherichia coli]